MKNVSLSILLGSLLIGGSIIYSGLQDGLVDATAKSSVSDDLRYHLPPITKEMVLATVTSPENHDRIKNLRGFDIDPKNPLWVRSTKDEKMVVVAYRVMLSDNSTGEVQLAFEQDEFGRWVADETNPPIYIRK